MNPLGEKKSEVSNTVSTHTGSSRSTKVSRSLILLTLLVVFLFTLAVVLFISFVAIFAREQLLALLSGSGEVTLSSVAIVGQGREAKFDDGYLMMYMANSLREAQKGEQFPEWQAYTITFHFSKGPWFTTRIWPITDRPGFHLEVEGGLWPSESIPFDVLFRHDVPGQIMELWNFLKDDRHSGESWHFNRADREATLRRN
jgi:hypothetical protein